MMIRFRILLSLVSILTGMGTSFGLLYLCKHTNPWVLLAIGVLFDGVLLLAFVRHHEAILRQWYRGQIR